MCLLVKGRGEKRANWKASQNADTVGPEVIKWKKRQVNDFTMRVTYTEVK